MPVIRVSEAAVEAVKEWARPLETRPQVMDRVVKVAVEGPPEGWLAEVIDFRHQIPPELAGQLAQHILSRWPELREYLGPDPGEGGES